MNENKKMPQACIAMPYYEFDEGLFEIDEFDCCSTFIVKGNERALLLDTGVGIGDLRWVIENRILQDMPYDVLISHNHGDHVGGAGWFSEVYVHDADKDWQGPDVAPTLDFRRQYADLIRRREGKHYAYDPGADIREWPATPRLLPLSDGQRFDLGGRTLTALHCPGHTAGEMVFIDDKSRTLFVGDACNGNFLLNLELAPTQHECLQITLDALRRIWDMRSQYDRVYNFHHDFRGFGQPLAPEVLPDLIACLEELQVGTAHFDEIPNPLLFADAPKTRWVARHGSAYVSLMAGDIRTLLEKG